MPKLLYAAASPYSAKVRMAATHVGIAIELVETQTGPQPEALTSVNPLGKIPCLVTEAGEGIYDSRVIVLHLNRIAGGALFPRNSNRRLEAERLEALADGVCDALLAQVYEHRMRPPEKVHQPWLDLQWSKVARTLGRLESDPPTIGRKIHAGHIALRACLGYLALRFTGRWEEDHKRLVQWAVRFDRRFPDLAAYVPAAQA